MNLPHRVYIAGPFSGDVVANCNRAVEAARRVADLGHWVHCPHSHTLPLHGLFDYDWFMALDKTYLEHWATALLYIGQSRGADLELGWAEELGLEVWKSIGEIPKATGHRSALFGN